MELEPVWMPAWWDPKKRKIIIDKSTFVCGMLAIGQDSLVFTSVRGVEFVIPLDSLKAKWLVGGLTCDLITADRVFRIFLAPPGNDAPRLSKSAFRSIAGHLETLGDISPAIGVVLGSGLSNVADIAGGIGNLLEMGPAIMDVRDGYRNRSVLKSLIG
jgi:hypothetical protein